MKSSSFFLFRNSGSASSIPAKSITSPMFPPNMRSSRSRFVSAALLSWIPTTAAMPNSPPSRRMAVISRISLSATAENTNILLPLQPSAFTLCVNALIPSSLWAPSTKMPGSTSSIRPSQTVFAKALRTCPAVMDVIRLSADTLCSSSMPRTATAAFSI